MCLFKHYSCVPVETVIRERFALLTETIHGQKQCFTSYSTIVNYLLKRYASDVNNEMFDANISIFREKASW